LLESQTAFGQVVRALALVAGLAGASMTDGAAQPLPPGPAPQSAGRGWTAGAHLGAVGAAGNTESGAFTAGLLLDYAGPAWAWNLDAEVTVHRVEESDGEADHEHWEDVQAHSNLRRLLSPRWYALLKAKGDHRPRSGLERDVNGGVGVGALLESAEHPHSLRIEAGLTGVSEEHVGGASLEYAALFLRSVLATTLASGSEVSWANDLRFGAGAGSRLKSDQEIELKAPLTPRWALRVELEWRYDAEPPVDYESDDLKLSVGAIFQSRR